MPRTYVRKTEINSYSLETLHKALHDIRENHKKIREVGRSYGIPESTLRKQLLLNKPCVEPLGRRPLFSAETELELKDYILNLCNLFYGLTPKELRRLVFKYAEAKQIKNSFNNELGLAGKDWLYCFLKRHPEIKLRQPEGTSINRIAAFNKEEVGLFYQNIEEIFKRHPFSPHKIYNQDETGITTVQKKCPKVYGPKGAKKVGAATSAERGRNITALFAANAAGNFIPPLMVYPRKRMSTQLQRNGPVGAVYTCSSNGWSNEEIFLQWLAHFKTHAHPTESEPVLLILDNHSSHVSLDIYNFCRANFIHMVSLPPHTSHRLQPLDLTFFGPLKNALYREYDCHLTTTGHQKITEYDVAELLNKAFMKTATMKNAISGFNAAGIFPFDSNKFSENEFVSASTPNDQEIFVTSCETPQNGKNLTELTEISNEDGLDNSTSCDVPKSGGLIPRNIIYGNPKPSTSKDNSFLDFAPVPVKKMRPMPSEKKQIRREKQRSELLTSTPMKVKLQEAERKRKVSLSKKKEREIRKAARLLNLEGENKSKISKGKKPTAKKQKGKRSKKTIAEDENSDESEVDMKFLCQDQDIDVDMTDIVDPNAVEKTSADLCSACNDVGKDGELWYRCVYCSSWSHAACTGWDSPENYICDFCKVA